MLYTTRFKTMLKYKSDHAGVVYEHDREVNEAYTTLRSGMGVSQEESPYFGVDVKQINIQTYENTNIQTYENTRKYKCLLQI